MRIAILTPDPDDEGHRTRWREVLSGKAALLEQAGMAVEGRPWTELDGLAGLDLVMPLLVWGYHRAFDQWREAVARWEALGIRLQNPPSVLRRNVDKAYLGELAALGAPVVPTRYVDRLTKAELDDATLAFDTDRLIAKPRISASAWRTIRWSPGTPLDGGPDGPAMIQPYLPAIETEGEVSLIFLGGAFSHAIDKRPETGDFRVQPEHGAAIRPHRAAADERAAAEAILERVVEDLLYARVDLVRGHDGRPLLMELELIEPDLYLEHGEQSGSAFAAAVGRAAHD